MKSVKIKFDNDGCSTVIENVIDEYHAKGFSFYMTTNTEVGVNTVYKVDSSGYFVAEKNTQLSSIREMIPAGRCECGAKTRAACDAGACNMMPTAPDLSFPSAEHRWYLGQ